MLPEFDKNSIRQKASALKLKKEQFRFTEQDEDIFRSHYNFMTTKKFIQEFFPEKSESAIHTKANRMGLKSRLKWTKSEIDIMHSEYAFRTNKYLQRIFFPNRSIAAIQSQAEKMGLEKDKTNTQFEKDEMLDLLVNLSKELGHTPTSREIRSLSNMPSPLSYHRYFGSYSNACREADLPVNEGLHFGESISSIASDGTLCLSLAERKITEYLIENKITFNKEVHYKDICDDERCSNMRTDWVLEDGTVIEYFGMMDKDYYAKKSELKILICKDNKIHMIDLYPKDLKDLNQALSHKRKSVTTGR